MLIFFFFFYDSELQLKKKSNKFRLKSDPVYLQTSYDQHFWWYNPCFYEDEGDIFLWF